MPDPGVAPDPVLTDGQRDLAALQDKGVPAPDQLTYKSRVSQSLALGGASKQQIDEYWGDARPPAVGVNNAAGTNITDAVAGNPAAGQKVLSNPVDYLGAALGVAADGLRAYVKSPYGAAVARGLGNADQQWSAGNAELLADRPDPSDPDAAVDAFSTIGHLGMAGMDYSSSVFNRMWAPIGGAINAAVNPAVGAIHMNDVVDKKGNVVASLGAGGRLPQDFTGDTVGLVAGFALGGEHATAPAVIPESTRYTALEATHTGELPHGPSDIVDHHVGAASPAAVALKEVIPSSDDFGAAAARIVGNTVNRGAISRVSNNLQQIWVRTGLHPQDAIDLAAHDPTYREELFTQDIAGNPVAPHFQAFGPSQPKPYVEKVAPTEQAGPPNPAAGQTYTPSVDNAMGIMKALEGSGVRAVSTKGAQGTYQIEPYTARQYMGADFDMNTLMNPQVNYTVARTIITDLYHRYNGNMEAMAIGYNAGPGRAAKWMANSEGAGTRLEAVRDNSMRSGWRYDKVPTSRDEAWLPMETQQYVARARYRMGGKAEPTPKAGEAAEPLHDGGPRVTTPEGTVAGEDGAREPYVAPEPKEGAEPVEEEEPDYGHVDERTGESATEGGSSVGAATAWGLDRDIGDAYEELSSNVGDQRDLPKARGLSLYDGFIGAFMSRMQPAQALDDLLKRMGIIDPAKEYGIRDGYSQVTKSDWRAQIAANDGSVKWDGDAQRWNVDHDAPTARMALAEANKTGNSHDFMNWLAARRVMVLEVNRKINTGFNVGAAARIMADDSEREKYQGAADLWDQYNHGVIDYGVSSGRWSAKEGEAMKNAGAWVSFRRLRGDDQSFTIPSKGFATTNPLKKMEGADGQIVDPLLASLDNNAQIFRSADTNLATTNLIKFAEGNPKFAAAAGLMKIGEASAPDMDEVDNLLKKYGFGEDQMDEARTAFGSLIQERADAKLGGNTFTFYRDGKKETWQTSWPELANMIRGSTPLQAMLLVRVFRDISAAVRTGVTALPDFAVRTFGSHQMIQFINNPLHPPPFLTGFGGLIKGMGMHDLMTDAMANGAFGTSIIDMDRDALYETKTQVLGETGVFSRTRNDISNYKERPSLAAAAKAAGQGALDTALAPLRMSRALQERLDQGNRLGLMEQGKAKGMSWAKAGSNAAEAGIDYTNGPSNALVSWWSSMVPFMRPSLLYTENALKAIERNPAAYAAYATGAVTLPKMALFGLNMLADAIPPGQPGYVPEEDKYRNIPNWEKLYYYISPPVNGVRLKLRLPAFAGFGFGAVPEAIMQGMYEHDPMTFQDLFQSWLREYIPPSMPPALKVPVESGAGYNFDTWQPLVPAHLQGALPELQYTPNSSAAAKTVSRLVSPALRSTIGNGPGALQITPIALDHLAAGWTGTLGEVVMHAVNAVTNTPGEEEDWTALPIVKGFFIQHPQLNGQIISDYYNAKSQFDQEAKSRSVIRADARMGDVGNMNLASEVMRYAQADAKLNKVSAALSRQRDTIWGIERNTTMSPDEKRQNIEAITLQSMQLAYSATHAMRQFNTPKGRADTQPVEGDDQ